MINPWLLSLPFIADLAAGIIIWFKVKEDPEQKKENDERIRMLRQCK